MRSQIAYALIVLATLLVVVLLARSRLRRGTRPPKHLRIDLLSGDSGEARAGVDGGGSSLSQGGQASFPPSQ
jgi:hypothetical protein